MLTHLRHTLDDGEANAEAVVDPDGMGSSIDAN